MAVGTVEEEEGQTGSSLSRRILWEGGGVVAEENEDRFSPPLDNDVVIVGVDSEQRDEHFSPGIRNPL